ncbi:MmpS family transport accessory protein [Mycobacterium talmoniae]|uniref:MmpS family transport accessory protein n=1 Tax=Mycobacterium talmoniae TaxID=1858794 RepID=UPI0009F5891B
MWLPVAILVVLAFVAFGVSRVRSMSEAISYPPATDTIAPTVVPINPKNVTYQVFGDLGGAGKVVYADLDGAPIEVALTSLPWSYTETTTSPAVTLSLVTQVDGSSVGCRILVNGEVRDERTVAHAAAAAACTVTAA